MMNTICMECFKDKEIPEDRMDDIMEPCNIHRPSDTGSEDAVIHYINAPVNGEAGGESGRLWGNLFHRKIPRQKRDRRRKAKV